MLVEVTSLSVILVDETLLSFRLFVILIFVISLSLSYLLMLSYYCLCHAFRYGLTLAMSCFLPSHFVMRGDVILSHCPCAWCCLCLCWYLVIYHWPCHAWCYLCLCHAWCYLCLCHVWCYLCLCHAWCYICPCHAWCYLCLCHAWCYLCPCHAWC